MTKQEFNEYLDVLTAETGWDFDKVHKAFAYQAAKHYHEMQVKNCSIPAVVGQSEQLVCDCQDFENGMVSMYCQVHNENPYTPD